MATEFVINKGRDDYYVEVYRCDNEGDAEDRFVQYMEKHGAPDYYSETPWSKGGLWHAKDGVDSFWLELRREQV